MTDSSARFEISVLRPTASAHGYVMMKQKNIYISATQIFVVPLFELFVVSSPVNYQLRKLLN